MELMSTSFDKFYKYVYSVLDDVIPEEILGKITLAVSIWLSHHWCALREEVAGVCECTRFQIVVASPRTSFLVE